MIFKDKSPIVIITKAKIFVNPKINKKTPWKRLSGGREILGYPSEIYAVRRAAPPGGTKEDFRF